VSIADNLAQVYYLYTKQAAMTLLTCCHGHKTMSNKPAPQPDPVQPMIYQIRIQGHLDDQWTDWFSGLTITLEENGETLLTGPLIDQAALFGLLRKVRDLGLPLISVSPVEPGPPTALPLRGLRRTGQVDQSDIKS
jgi:hypothetical protein